MQIVMCVVVEIALRYESLFILNIEYQDLRFISGLLPGNDEKPNCHDQCEFIIGMSFLNYVQDRFLK